MGNFNRDNRFGGGRNERGFSRRDFGRPMMHKATCNDCGKECEVPFRPTGERPVFCNDCFRNRRDAGPGRPVSNNTDRYKEQFDILNSKLDKIIKVLTPVVPAKNKKEEKIKKPKQ